MRATGNTILVTGGTSGIGLALARSLADGNTVIVCGRDAARLEAARAVPGLVAISADVAEPADRVSLVARLATDHPGLNVVVNNAGRLSVCDPASPEIARTLESELATNVIAPVALTAMLLPTLRRARAATIVNVTTGYVYLPSVRVASYSASKAALRVMTRTLRFSLKGTGIRVVEVMPPAVDTAMARDYPGAKMSAEAVAVAIRSGLIAGRSEIVIGMSRAARVLARLAPGIAFAAMNRTEARGARDVR